MQRQPLSFLIHLIAALSLAACTGAGAAELDSQAIGQATGTEAKANGDVVRIGWVRDEIVVNVDGARLPPAAGLGSWAAFKPTVQGDGAIVMGDTVVFQDEVDAAMDAALAHDLNVTALHNHFFYDEPKAYFMHIGGRGPAPKLAKGVKAVWDAIKQVRADRPQPATSFAGAPPPRQGKIDVEKIAAITGLNATTEAGGVVKVSTPREARMGETTIGGSMGLTAWAAFVGNRNSASVDGDFIMAADEVQPVLRAMREQGFHVVALHNHMIGETPAYYFTHYWGKGPAEELAQGFKAVLDAQAAVN